MLQHRYDKLICVIVLTGVMLFGISGCKRASEAPGAVMNDPMQTAPTTVATALPTETDVPPSTVDTMQETEPSTESEETAPEGGTTTQQPEPEPLEKIQSDVVIDTVVGTLTDQLPQLNYDAGQTDGTVVKLLVAPKQSNEAMSDSLLKDIQNLFGDTSDTAPEQSDGYTYSLTYQGASDDGQMHCFAFSYISNEYATVTPVLNTDEVVAQVTRNILNSTAVDVNTFNGNGYTVRVEISDVAHFYNTRQAVDALTFSVEAEIEERNMAETVYTEFCLVFDSKTETSYVFVLYLR